MQRAQNKNLWPSAADQPNLAVLKLSRAEPLQPYFWAKSSEILDLRSLGDMESLGLSPFCLKMFLKIDKYPNVHNAYLVGVSEGQRLYQVFMKWAIYYNKSLERVQWVHLHPSIFNNRC